MKKQRSQQRENLPISLSKVSTTTSWDTAPLRYDKRASLNSICEVDARETRSLELLALEFRWVCELWVLWALATMCALGKGLWVRDKVNLCLSSVDLMSGGEAIGFVDSMGCGGAFLGMHRMCRCGFQNGEMQERVVQALHT